MISNPHESPDGVSDLSSAPLQRKNHPFLIAVVPPGLAVLGAYLGFEYFMSGIPDPAALGPDEYVCGLSVLPAMFVGAPAGAIMFYIIGRIVARRLS